MTKKLKKSTFVSGFFFRESLLSNGLYSLFLVNYDRSFIIIYFYSYLGDCGSVIFVGSCTGIGILFGFYFIGFFVF